MAIIRITANGDGSKASQPPLSYHITSRRRRHRMDRRALR